MPDAAFLPTGVLGKKIVKENLKEEKKHTNSPISADTEEAGAPVPTSLDDHDCGPATGSPDRLLHHSLGWCMAPGESRMVINLETKKIVQKDNHQAKTE